MGASLGLVLAFCLVRLNVGDVGAMIQNAFDPGGTLAVFVGSLVLNFGIGAALTGYVLMEIDKV